MPNPKDKTKDLGDYLKKKHKGQRNAASSKILEAVFDLKNREIRKCINTLRCSGFPICSDTFGYYYPATADEVDTTVAQLESRITKIAKAKDGMLEIFSIPDMPDTISINITFPVGQKKIEIKRGGKSSGK